MPEILRHRLGLLRSAAAHNQHAKALMRATGEHYNIFKILGIGHYEVKTHSPMLGDLLNPKGSHGQGDAFLRLFVERMSIAGFDAASARLELEHRIGLETEKSGGRIDIVIFDGAGNTIFIENKIFAGDQDKQLRRYRERNAQATLFYLTLDGGKPRGCSDEDLIEIRATCISYAADIRDWLVACQKEAAALPHVRESISQYLYLVRELTGQSTTQSMNEELIKQITADEDSIAAYFGLISEVENVKAKLVTLLDAQLDEAAKDANLRRQGPIEDLHIKYSGIYFTTDFLEKHNLLIGFSFDRAGYQDLDFGFRRREEDKPCECGEKLLAAFQEGFPSFVAQSNEYWPAWTDYEPPFGYWGDEAFQAIASGHMASNMKDKLIIMSKIAKQILPA
jgi:hypothetical protein